MADDKKTIKNKHRSIEVKSESKTVDKETAERFSYQQEAIANLKLLDDTKKSRDYYSTLVVVPTGGGKTRIAVEYLYKHVINEEHKVLWLAERLLLLTQAEATFKKLAYSDFLTNRKGGGVIYRTISSKDEKYDKANFNSDVDLVIITQQTLVQRIDDNVDCVDDDELFINNIKKWLKDTDCLTVIIDEAHHACTNPYQKIIESLWNMKGDIYKRLHIIGLTATPKREDNDIIEKTFTHGVIGSDENRRVSSATSYAYHISISDLVAKSILSTPCMIRVNTEGNVSTDIVVNTYIDGISHHDFFDGTNGEKVKISPHSFGKTIVFADSRVTALELEYKFNDALKSRDERCGLAISFDKDLRKKIKKSPNKEILNGISFSDKRKQVKEDLKNFNDGDLDLIITRDMLLEGVDFPKTQTIFVVRTKTNSNESKNSSNSEKLNNADNLNDVENPKTTQAPDNAQKSNNISDVTITQMVGRALRGEPVGGTHTAFIVSFNEEHIEKILWETPDSYSKKRKWGSWIANFEEKKKRKPKVYDVDDEIDSQTVENDNTIEKMLFAITEEEKIRAEHKFITRAVKKGLISVIPKGYYILHKSILLVWSNTELWMKKVIKNVEEIVKECGMQNKNKGELYFSYFKENHYTRVRNYIENTLLIDKFHVSDIVVQRSIHKIIQFYLINCKESIKRFNDDKEFVPFSDLSCYDLSEYLVEFISRDYGLHNIDDFASEVWERDGKLSKAWGKLKTFQKFLKDFIYKFKNAVKDYDCEEVEGDDDNSDRFRVRLYRDGRKRLELCDMLRDILTYSSGKFKRFVDVFGGTGTVTAQMYKQDFEKRIYNDYNPNLVNFLYCVSDNSATFSDTCRDMINKLTVDKKNADNQKLIMQGINAIWERLYTLDVGTVEVNKKALSAEVDRAFENKIETLNENIYKLSLKEESNYVSRRIADLKRKIEILTSSDEVTNITKIFIAYFYISARRVKALNDDRDKWVAKFNKEDLDNNEADERAFHYLFGSSFTSHQASSESITGVDHEGIIQLKETLSVKKGNWLGEFHKRTKGVDLRCEDFRDILDDFIEDEEAIVYLDPPYFLTAQYADPFPDKFHLDMLEWIRTAKCKWVFSCKDIGTSQTGYKDWNVRTGVDDKGNQMHDELIHNEIIEDAQKRDKNGKLQPIRLPCLLEYFKGFIYKMAENKEAKIEGQPDDVIVYTADETHRVNDDDLFVYKLQWEKYHEIMISNISIPSENIKHINNNGIEIQRFNDFLDELPNREIILE
jgi:superfamily II DNA or RNA helicase/site-specific DNA-adenine methylase